MLANYRVIFFHFKLFRRRALVFGCRVEMTCTSGGNQLDFIAHKHLLLQLNLLTLGTQIGENGINTFFIDDTHTMRRNSQAHKAPFTFNPKAMDMQVWQKATTSLVIGV
jgi:hypothetical protein